MSDEYAGLAETMNKLLGGAGATAVFALLGRLMWHGQEVRAKRRRFLGRELIWEFPMALTLGLIGEGLADWAEISSNTQAALIAGLAYLGPKGTQAILESWWQRRGPGGKP